MEGSSKRGRFSLAEGRVLPFFQIGTRHTAALAMAFEGRRLVTARSIYMAAVELSTGPAGAGSATRGELGTAAGVGSSVVSEYLPLLEQAGLLRLAEEGVGWILTDPPEGGPAPIPEADPDAQLAETLRQHDVPDEVATDAAALLAQKQRVDGKLVKPDEMVKAAVALAEFNRQNESAQGLGTNLVPIVGRIRERPALDAGAHRRLVQVAFEVRWWEKHGRDRGGRLGPNVIYGNPRCFENCVQDAVERLKEGKPAEEVRRGRFERTRSVEG